MNPDAVRQAVRDLLLAVGEDPDRPELAETPRRVTESFAELLSGSEVDASGLLQALPGEGIADGEAVVVSRLSFRSMCEHHLLPFRGMVHLVYAPSEQVAGFGSFARVLDVLAARLQVQERLTGQFADAVESGLDARGVVVVIEASHGCLSDRGALQADARAITMASRGIYRDAALRSEALRLIPMHDGDQPAHRWITDAAGPANLGGVLAGGGRRSSEPRPRSPRIRVRAERR
ncbi:GTP cyclohydrolase I [Agromyces sp. NPDC049794]|uniref:GTP cyclohydrolase I n=1 Tax=unclassified Agromyces TaxID=2639701 RepID=UPI0033CB57CE